MKKETVLSGLVGVLVGIVITSLFVPAWNGMNYRNFMMGSTGSMDARFIEQMIPHHEDAITMADIALEKNTHAEIAQLATDIKRTQREEIEKMRTWYKDWYGQDVPYMYFGTNHRIGSGMLHMGMMGDATDIQRLKTTPSFDKAFIEEMIPHHQMAVMMAQMLQQTTTRSEMKELAKDIIAAQTREINSMREWYRQWYGK